jgi:hypothetical protein
MRWTAVSKNSSGRQLRASLAATVRQDGTAGARPHAQAEAVLAGTTAVVRLVRTLAHEWFLTQGVEVNCGDRSGSGWGRHQGADAIAGSGPSTATARSQIYAL